jgi:hypothetical protein
MNRAERRAAAKRRRQNDPQQLAADQIGLFDKIPEVCDTCQKPFDKTDRNMVLSWSVVVRQETVRLFCPECIGKAKKAFQGGKNEPQNL